MTNSNDGTTIKVLLVDDKPNNLLALETMLDGCDYQLIKAHSGVEALRQVLAHDFAVVLLDLVMPGMDGFETAAQIRSRERSRGTPIIFVTASKDEGTAAHGYALGAVDYLTKPVVPEILRSKVAVFAELARVRQALAGYASSLEARVDLILEAAGEGIYGLDREGRATFVNAAAARLLGYRPQELLGCNMHAQIHHSRGDGQPYPASDCPIFAAFHDGAVYRVSDECFWRGDGSSFPVEYVSTPITGNGGIAGAVVVFSDISERKQAERALAERAAELERRVAARTAELVAANRELEAFSYSVAHDLRAPLRSIAGFGEILVQEYGPQLDAEAQQHIQRIQAGTTRMGQLIDDLLNLSRVTRNDMRHQRVNLTSLARSVAAELRRREPQRRVQVEIADGLLAQGDPRLLRLVLENLLANAWKYTGKHDHALIEVGTLPITASSLQPAAPSPEHEAGFFVRDNGAGFDMAYAGKLFGPFQRLHSNAEFDGTGIGLAIVQRIVHRHGGRIWADGAVERGATFYFTLPRPSERSEPVEDAADLQVEERQPSCAG